MKFLEPKMYRVGIDYLGFSTEKDKRLGNIETEC